ncbi:TatD family hydrolase [Neiella sp. HB171785]|uniref:TatD family hydrolase n=1 Tax=Neiella litorisoli TaxID=2771431 RepID=A0A8J6UF20_9GAMM|nr:TatD family hydrolase [Neiella litorisoli]MBD1390389.1 TatD family hydrolase [Neiella litorisoli]
MNQVFKQNAPLALFDSHCHFDFQSFDSDRQQIWQQCRQVGVSNLLVPAVHTGNWQAVIELAQNYGVVCALGLHPYWTERHRQADIALLASRVAQLLAESNSPLVAIGECGLDAVAAPAQMSKQIDLLSEQLALAQQFDLPVVLHVRKAHAELQQLLKQFQGIKGVVHAFSGSVELGASYIRLGMKLGIGGTITYPRANKTRQAVAQLPLASLLLETDAPDMPINGRQGQRNSPLYLPQVLDQLAALRTESKSDIAECLWRNSNELFSRTSST